jgi:hypothetical protein
VQKLKSLQERIMSGISDIRQAPGFSQQDYNYFIQHAKTEKVDTAVVDSLLLSAINKGKDFYSAMKLVQQDLPKLSQPNVAAFALLKDWPALPSPGALIMSLTTEYAAEQRKQNQQLMWAQTEALVDSMKAEADKMREMARVQLALGIVSGVISIATGFAQIGLSTHGFKSGEEAIMKKFNEISNAVGQIGSGLGKMFDAGSQYAGSMAQAEMKEMQADQEKMRALRDSIKDLNEALRELIQKSLAAQNDIQSTTNQTRTRILA